MNDQESPSSSWLLRTHFSRAICHRPGTCNTSSTWLNLLSTEGCHIPGTFSASSTWLDSLPKEVTFLSEKSKNKILREDRLGCEKSQGLGACGSSKDNNKNEETKQTADFSFPCVFSSSPPSMRSESSGHFKSTFDYFSPSSDEDAGAADSVQPARPSCSDSNWFLRSMFNSLSSGFSRWSVSSDSLKGNQEHSIRSSSKGSWFSWVSPKASPKSSPKVSPTTTPKGSPRNSFRYSINTRDSAESDRDDPSLSKDISDICRAPSWSQHLFSAGNERAVISLEKWMIDLSQLLLGKRFDCGNHSRLYHGKYKDSPVAVKVIRQPDDDALLADRLEQIFTNEVTTLSILNHHNIIQDMRPSIPSDCPPELEDLMRRCWSRDVNQRPQFWEIMRTLTMCKQSLNSNSGTYTLKSPPHYSSMPSWLQAK